MEILLSIPTGLTMANKIQRTHKLDNIIEHVIYEKNVRRESHSSRALLNF
jgi:hypothetical protein